ncbi:MAG: 2-C-methyl-D-erythritol 2,4-cyclodiphosphate synthase [Planctomycetota bacterium]|nr:MAG: 2-C-methyl-D-erythritol 2,4-cyclodiphosphate synthase [Planctomycetota bacterium]
MRVGLGIDGHKFCEDRPLMLGGLIVKHDKGLLGHSDGDVVLHAAIDAILGASGEGDIGDLFPDTDSRFKDISSAVLAREVCAMVEDEGWIITSLDITIIADAPKLGGVKSQIGQNMGAIFGCPVSVKAKTTEGLGASGDSMSAYAIALLVPKDSQEKKE